MQDPDAQFHGVGLRPVASRVSRGLGRAAVDDAIAAGRWLVLVFHGVGGEHGLNVETVDFAALVRYLSSKRDSVWTDSFINVAKRLHSVRQQEVHDAKL